MSDYKVINDNGYERSWEELYEDNVMFSKYTDKLENENKRLYELVMYLILPKRICNHELATDTKKEFMKIIKDNLNEDTSTIRFKIEEYWDNMGKKQHQEKLDV